MNILQISVFLENRAGQLAEITRLLADNNIDIRALSIAETADYGLARMVVSESYKASQVLLKHGNILSMTPVWAVEVPDQPGGLADLLAVLADNNIDVEYMYSLFGEKEGHAYMVLRITNEATFLSVLGERRIKIAGMEELGLK